MNNTIGIGILNIYDNSITLGKNTITTSIQNHKNSTWAKNYLLRNLICKGYEHLFILENSIKIINDDVFEKYIEAAQKSGIWHLMFKGNSNQKNAIDYNGIGIDFTNDINKHFCYYYRGIIKNVGFYDERYDKGILEQHDLTYKIIHKGLSPGWGWSPDLENSKDYIQVIHNTKIEKNQDWWYENTWFNHKHKISADKIPELEENVVLEKLNFIKEHYSK